MNQNAYNKNWNTGSAYDFKEIFNQESEVFYFFYFYLNNDYTYFLKEAKNSNNIKKNKFKKMVFLEDSYEKRALEVILNSKLLERGNKTSELVKAKKKFNKKYFFIDEEIFERIQIWFLVYLSEVNYKVKENPDLIIKYKIQNKINNF